MDAIAAAGPDISGRVGVDAVGETGVGVGEDATVRERGVAGADVVGVDCGGSGGVWFEVLGAGVGYVEGFEIGGKFLCES